MDLSFILKIVGIGLIVSVSCQILSKSGRDEQSTLLSIGGILVVMVLIVTEFGDFLKTISRIFQLS